jgi:hypothetical protein
MLCSIVPLFHCIVATCHSNKCNGFAESVVLVVKKLLTQYKQLTTTTSKGPHHVSNMPGNPQEHRSV